MTGETYRAIVNARRPRGQQWLLNICFLLGLWPDQVPRWIIRLFGGRR